MRAVIIATLLVVVLGCHRSESSIGTDQPDRVGQSGRVAGGDRSDPAELDFATEVVQPQTFTRMITLPAMVAERPGQSQLHITAPLTGVVTAIYPSEGQAVKPRAAMFEIRLMHEELVAAQRDFLQTAENIDVVTREIERLQRVPEGIVPGKRVLDEQYNLQRLQGSLRAQRQALILHGLSEGQIDAILASRKLMQSLQVAAPEPPHVDPNAVSSREDAEASVDAEDEDHLYHVQKLSVTLGQHVEAGETLCVLADHCELYIEGSAFEDDAAGLRAIVREGKTISARVIVGSQQTDRIENLRLAYLADHVDPQSRAFKFYVDLPNSICVDRCDSNDQRFISWRFNPGQRMELDVPVETLSDCIVLPREAVVEDGAASYVYEQDGDHFHRIQVHVEYRDRNAVVLANDGQLREGQQVVTQGAYQVHLATTTRRGSGHDPHAGHQH
ncbi:MAG: efflux RND transporter periplasmic adaptor subunit [Pirellulaceae bacterium]|nr:efflux RND transporter periplasmic adaptor subunit [Planctomycetales bacterium]